MKKSILLLAALTTAFVSCKKEDKDHDDHSHEGELITTVVVTAVDGDGNEQKFEFADLDGIGGNKPTIDTIRLSKGLHSVSLAFYDDSDLDHGHEHGEEEEHGENITTEILEEMNDHLICFTTDDILEVLATDKDDNGLPIGITSSWHTIGLGTTSINIQLKHQPGIKNGECALGETDIDVTFPLIIE